MGTLPSPSQSANAEQAATLRLRRSRPLTTLQPTKRQPATVGAVERAGESRLQGKRQRGQAQIVAPPHMSTLAMH